MAQVVWSSEAREDLLAIYEYIAHERPAVAERMITELVLSTNKLIHFPRSGRLVPELADDTTREIVRAPYVIAYRVSGERVEILKVRHGRQLLHLREVAKDDD